MEPRARRGRQEPAAQAARAAPTPGPSAKPGERPWALRACSCCSCGHDHARLPQTMVHVSFRYIFGIPPLILVLLPVASSDCEIEGRSGEEYEHVLRISLQALERRENESNCLDNEPNFFKKHSCDDNKEATFLKTAARKLKQFLKMNIQEEVKRHLLILSQGTLKLLNCTRKEKEKKQPSLGEAQPTKNMEEKKSLKEQKKLDEMCFLKILLGKIQTCWNKILHGTKEH
ncbi:interleukin-7 isoform X2 [Rousettus aegyptiacus]|nr:interleukin-7 isoform X2 [Rousettus aegyptiacus]